MKRLILVVLALILLVSIVGSAIASTQATDTQQAQGPSVCLQWATITPAPTQKPCVCVTVTPIPTKIPPHNQG
jgi:hypothetical protein